MTLRRIFLSLLLSVLLPTLCFAGDEICNGLLHLYASIQPKLGQGVDFERDREARAQLRPLDALSEFKKGYAAFYLGKGISAAVYRVLTFEPQQSFVVKAFQGRVVAQHDQVALNLLQDLAKGQESVKVVSSKIISANEVHTLVQMDDIQGRTLFSILVDPLVNEAVKRNLRQRYEAFAAHLTHKLKEQFQISASMRRPKFYHFESEMKSDQPFDEFSSLVELQPDLWTAFIPNFQNEMGEKCVVNFIIKSDNFIVTQKGDLVLIDPN